MGGQCARRGAPAAALDRLLVGDAGQFVQPVGAKTVERHVPHLSIVGQQVVVGDPVAELPSHPGLERLGFLRPGHAARLGDRGEKLLLPRIGQLPEVGLEGVFELVPAEQDRRHPRMLDPFLARHESEDEIQHPLAAHIEEVSPARVQWRPVDLRRAAQTARFGFTLEEHKRAFAGLQQAVREAQPRRAGFQDAIAHLDHRTRKAATDAIIQ